MSCTGPPTTVRSLEQRVRNAEGSDGVVLRRRIGMALVVVGQMLPEGAIKGGGAMALRYGRATRFTQDLDAARVRPLAKFRSVFEDPLAGDLTEPFTEVGLGALKAAPVMRSDHQVDPSLLRGWRRDGRRPRLPRTGVDDL